eukprot:gene16470-22692_t
MAGRGKRKSHSEAPSGSPTSSANSDSARGLRGALARSELSHTCQVCYHGRVDLLGCRPSVVLAPPTVKSRPVLSMHDCLPVFVSRMFESFPGYEKLRYCFACISARPPMLGKTSDEVIDGKRKERKRKEVKYTEEKEYEWEKDTYKDGKSDSESGDDKDKNNTACEACGSDQNPEKLLCCDRCPRVFHLKCLDPPLEKVPRGSWFVSQTTANQRHVLIRFVSQTTANQRHVLLRFLSQTTANQRHVLIRFLSQTTAHQRHVLIRFLSQTTANQGHVLIRFLSQTTANQRHVLISFLSQSTANQRHVLIRFLSQTTANQRHVLLRFLSQTTANQRHVLIRFLSQTTAHQRHVLIRFLSQTTANQGHVLIRFLSKTTSNHASPNESGPTQG